MPGEPPDKDVGTYCEMDFRSAEFPSDALSIRRLRKLFPQNFDGHGRIADGYANNDFFFPTDMEEPEHLLKLTQLICDERTVASAAYYKRYLDRHPELLNAEDLDHVDQSKGRLVEHYQLFKLADSPATARLLIQQVEEEGSKQAERERAQSR